MTLRLAGQRTHPVGRRNFYYSIARHPCPDRRRFLMGCNRTGFLHIFYKHSLSTVLGGADAQGGLTVPGGKQSSRSRNGLVREGEEREGSCLVRGSVASLAHLGRSGNNVRLREGLT